LAYKKIEVQSSVFHIHGFDIGFLGTNYLKDIHSVFKKILGYALDKLIEGKIIDKIGQADLFYVSTPDLVELISKWCGRIPLWLPNPVDTDIFSPSGKIIKLEGSPACFFPARLHGDKKPEIVIDIFQRVIKPKYKDATLHLLDIGELVNKYKKELSDAGTYFWYGFMDKETLAAKMRGADLIFGDFSIGALSLLPMQAMAVKRPVVTLDKYEIVKKDISELPELAIRILDDEKFRREYVEKNYDYILEKHSQKIVAQTHFDNLKKYCKI